MPARLRPDHHLRVASVPGGHPYVRSIVGPESHAVTILPDPPARDGATDRWWPPTMLTADWIAANANDVDVLHVHFGMESSTSAELEAVIAALRASGTPLVYTVHDLENPQLTDQAVHLEHLDLVVPAADALVTLTAGASAEIERRWGRRARVIGHPRVAADHEPAVAPSTGSDAETPTVVVHLRDLRPNIDGIGIVRSLAAASDLLDRPLRVVVDVNENVRDEAQLAAIMQVVDAAPALTVHRHARYDDDALEASLAAAAVAVLPYRFGTHSGWAELCWDLGVTIATPPVGYVAEQHPADTVVFDPPDAASLAQALDAALLLGTAAGSAERRTVVAARRDQRRVQSAAIAREHEILYREVTR
jgi:hypothetical protein